MPLSAAVRRSHHHRRAIECDGFLREDGLWDIEARMTDVKSQPVDHLELGYVSGGESFHDLSLRLTMDTSLLIKEVEACIDRSPFAMCSGIAEAFKTLEGTRIGPGWRKKCRDLLAGVEGCTHLNELLPVISTTAIQTMWPTTKEGYSERGARFMLNSCHTWSESSPVILKWQPALYKASGQLGAD